MSTKTADRQIPRGLLVTATVAGVAAGYGLAVDPVVLSASQVVYPLVWLTVSGVALHYVVGRHWSGLDALSALVGAGYTALLLAVAGLLRLPDGSVGVTVHHGFPGWGPTVALSTPVVVLTAVPFLVVGYATLGVLAATTARQTRTGALPGAVGLFACVSCVAPLIAGVAGAVGAGSLAAVLLDAQYPLATAVFVVAIGGFAAVLERGAEPNSRQA